MKYISEKASMPTRSFNGVMEENRDDGDLIIRYLYYALGYLPTGAMLTFFHSESRYSAIIVTLYIYISVYRAS